MLVQQELRGYLVFLEGKAQMVSQDSEDHRDSLVIEGYLVWMVNLVCQGRMVSLVTLAEMDSMVSQGVQERRAAWVWLDSQGSMDLKVLLDYQGFLG